MGALCDFLESYAKKGTVRLHMPGHKGRMPFERLSRVSQYDITEIEGADSLFEANGLLFELEQRFCSLYRSGATLLSAGGSTLCIQSMLALACRPGTRVLAGRNAHKAFVNTCALLDLDPVWLVPDCSGAFPLPISPAQLEAALLEHPDVTAVYLTSPDYFGSMCDVSACAAVCSRFNKPLLIDNAHGAHLLLLEGNRHPIKLGADFCCDSAHKTLPVFTGGALLHAKNPDCLYDARASMSLFGSTSPSYLILASLDGCADYLEQKAAQDYQSFARLCAACKETAARAGFLLPGAVHTDPLHLAFDARPLGYSGPTLGRYLRTHGFEPEYISPSAVVLLPTPFNTEEEFSSLEHILSDLAGNASSIDTIPLPSFPQALRRMRVRDAVFASSQLLPIDQCEGRIVAEAKTACPPGIPVLMPGEEIGKNIVNFCKCSGIFSLKVVE